MKPLWVLAVALLTPSFALAQAPQKLSYQGRLLKADGTPETGVVQLTFALYAAPDGGSSLWAEKQQNVGLADGYYKVVLGESTAFPTHVFDGADRWLELSVGDSVLTPRQQVTSVPYALTCTDARNVSGGSVDAASVSVSGQAIVAGNLGVGTATPAARSEVVGAPARSGTGLVTGFAGNSTLSGASTRFQTEVNSGDLIVANDGQTFVALAASSDTQLTVTPASTANFANQTFTIQKPVARMFRGDGGVGLIVNARGNVGIGTYAPTAPLDVAGRVAVNGNPVIQWQEFPTPLIKEFGFTGSQTLNVPLTGIPTDVRYILADVFVTASIDDHQVIAMGRGVTYQQRWVSIRGTRPSTVFGNLAVHAVTLVYPGQDDAFTSNYGLWYPSQAIPINPDSSFDFSNSGNSASDGWVYLVIRAYSL